MEFFDIDSVLSDYFGKHDPEGNTYYVAIGEDKPTFKYKLIRKDYLKLLLKRKLKIKK